MSDMQSLEEDLNFIRRAVDASEPPLSPATLFLWAVISLVGFMAMDLGASWVWAFLAPAGGVLSVLLHRRSNRLQGRVDGEFDWRTYGHWAFALPFSIFATMPLVITGAIDSHVQGQLTLLLVTLCYFTAGLHLHRVMLWLTPVGLGAYALTFIADDFAWTLAGIVLFAGLAGLGIVARRRR